MAEVAQLSQIASLAPPSLTAPEGEVYTSQQWKTLIAICEVFIPAIGTNSNALKMADLEQAVSQFEPYLPDSVDTSTVRSYLQESFADIPNIQEVLRSKFIQTVPPDGRNALGFILSTLNATAGSLLLTGSTTPIQEQPLAARTLIVSQWASSYLPPLRAIHRSFAGLSRQVWLQHTPTISKILDYPDTPKQLERGPSYKFKFHDFSSPSAPTTLSADAIIIGSGCGAGVVASTLSRAGLKVLVLEKSYHFDSSYFPMTWRSASENLFENGGGSLSVDSSILVQAGSNFGGGGTINWSASLQPSYTTRKEWSESSGLPLFTSPSFQSCLDYVCKRMGVPQSTDAAALSNSINHSVPNQYLLEGARRLGLSTITVPQNTGGNKHDCGYCSTGCSSCKKQGPVNNWLPDAAEHGAEFIQGCWVEKILFSSDSNSKDRTATGVKCTWTSPDRLTTKTLTLSAPRIIVSAGTLHSPLILQRSGLTNPNIGKNLHLHPVCTVFATYPQRTNPWEGGILTSAVTSLANSIPYMPANGPVIECLFSNPTYAGMFLPFRASLNTNAKPWAAALEYKLNAIKMGFSTAWVIIQRDIDSGCVYQDPSDPKMVRIKYTPSMRDRQGVLKGQIAAARIAFVMGASEIDVVHPSVSRYTRSTTASDETNQEAFELWLKEVEKKGVAGDPENALMGSAHQMGTNRMSSREDGGVVDGEGRVWGCSGLWVADASVFVSASGVNPMISTMGISRWVGENIVKGLEGKKSGK